MTIGALNFGPLKPRGASMTWSMAGTWWLLTGLLVALELATGTFYLLMLAAGTAAAALCAHLGLGTSTQLVSAGVVGGAAVAIWHLRRMRHPAALPAASNPDVNLDIGQTVQVNAWNEGMAEVSYRGARWQARYVGGATPSAGRHVIRAVQGSCLLLDR